MTTLSDLMDTMVNLRRVGVSLLLGIIFLMAAMLQAGAAQAEADPLAVTQRGLALGLQAGDDVATGVDTDVTVGEGVARALETLQGIVDRLADRQHGNGRGPLRAVEVHQALLEGRIPGSGEATGTIGHALQLFEQQVGTRGPGDLPPGLARKDG